PLHDRVNLRVVGKSLGAPEQAVACGVQGARALVEPLQRASLANIALRTQLGCGSSDVPADCGQLGQDASLTRDEQSGYAPLGVDAQIGLARAVSIWRRAHVEAIRFASLFQENVWRGGTRARAVVQDQFAHRRGARTSWEVRLQGQRWHWPPGSR